ncbi:hypothetical protein BHM03_00061615 [Ensete ventricosum]|nr:hypothetical protein BHM03_00061615 [Ensete ventricosum]
MGGCHPLRALSCSQPPLSDSPCGMATGGHCPLRAGPGRSRPPLCRGALATIGCPLVGGLIMDDRHYMGPGRGQPPLHADSMHMAAPRLQAAPTFAANRCNKCVEQLYALQSRHR